MTRAAKVKWTKKVENFILDKMAEGHDVKEITTKWPLEVPNAKTIYRRSLKDLEFAAKMDQAYTVLTMQYSAELNKLSSMTAMEAYPAVDDWRQAEATLKRRVDALKFWLGKMAPILSSRFDKAQKVEVKGDNLAPQLVIMNYADPSPKEIDITPPSS